MRNAKVEMRPDACLLMYRLYMSTMLTTPQDYCCTVKDANKAANIVHSEILAWFRWLQVNGAAFYVEQWCYLLFLQQHMIVVV